MIRYDSDCAPGGSAELWTMAGTDHSFTLSDDFCRRAIQFLLSHSCGVPEGEHCNENGVPNEYECPADFDGDGIINAIDLALLLGSWSPCE